MVWREKKRESFFVHTLLTSAWKIDQRAGTGLHGPNIGKNGRGKSVFFFRLGPQNQCARRTRNREINHCALTSFFPGYHGDLRVQIFLDQARRGRPTQFLRGATLDPPLTVAWTTRCACARDAPQDFHIDPCKSRRTHPTPTSPWFTRRLKKIAYENHSTVVHVQCNQLLFSQTLFDFKKSVFFLIIIFFSSNSRNQNRKMLILRMSLSELLPVKLVI